MDIKKIAVKHNNLLKKIEKFLVKKDFLAKASAGLVQSRFRHTYSPSAAHHIIDEIIVSQKEPYFPIDKFYLLPDRSIRVNDVQNVGISFRHLSFFELLVFGYLGAGESLPKKESVDLLAELMFKILNLDKNKVIITVLSSCDSKDIKLIDEDEVFYKAYAKFLPKENIFKTKGERNLFYSRVIDNPGSTGCEIYYKIGDKYIEIGSHVNYKFKFTGQLKRTRNQAVLEGFGFERFLMALENKENIYDISLIAPLKIFLINYFKKAKDESIFLFEENLNIIIDHLRSIAFIIFDGQKIENSGRGRILKRFIKGLHKQFVYLGVNKQEEFKIINQLFNILTDLFFIRYQGFNKSNQKAEFMIKKFINTL